MKAGVRLGTLGLAALLASLSTRAYAQALPNTPPPGSPALELDDTAEPAPSDSELYAPLTPLSEFDIETREPSPEDAGDSGPMEVRYAIEVAGLEATPVGPRFRDLSTLYEYRGDAAVLGQINARAEADAELLTRLLRSEGYFDSVVDVEVAPVEDQPGRAVVTLTATPGERYRLGDIQVTGGDTIPEGLVRSSLPLQTGDPIVATLVQGAEANVSLRLPEQGYPFVQVGQRDILLDEGDRTGAYTLPVDPGPRSRFGGVRLEGDRVFGPEHLAVIARFERGELYDSRKVDDLRRALIATGLFSTAGVQPVRTGDVAADGTETVDLQLHAEAAPPRSLAASAGYGTGEGVRLSASWTHRNLFPPEGALILGAVAGDKEQRLGATFRRSNAGRRDRTFQALAEGSRERRESYDATSLTLAARLSRDSTPIWRKRWTWSAGSELIASAETARADRPAVTYYIAAVPLQLGYDRSDDLLDPTRGFRLVGRVSPEVSFRKGTATYVRNIFDASAYLPVSDSLVLAARTRLGVIAGAERASIAPSRRLYGGGGGSVRGFSYRELGPVNADGERVGGRSLVEFAVEARYRFGNFGVVPFFDAGQAYESVTPQFSDLRYGVGIGARYYTNFGPIRIDLARPLSRRPGEPKLAVYVSIGQAF